MTRYASQLSKFTQQEIQKLYSSTVMRFRKGGLEIRYAPPKKPYGRILIVIPKKVGPAPLRNRLKRRLKALFYEKKWYEKNADLIVIARPEAARLSFDDLADILAAAFDAYNKKFPHSLNTYGSTTVGHV